MGLRGPKAREVAQRTDRSAQLTLLCRDGHPYATYIPLQRDHQCGYVGDRPLGPGCGTIRLQGEFMWLYYGGQAPPFGLCDDCHEERQRAARELARRRARLRLLGVG